MRSEENVPVLDRGGVADVRDASDRSVGGFDAQASIAAGAAVERVLLLAIGVDGRLRVADAQGQAHWADWLETSAGGAPQLAVGDRLLALRPVRGDDWVAIGRIGRYRAPEPARTVRIEATDAMTLQCGESSLELRADGKVMLRGQDVLLRARRTQRIKAGSVNIN